MPHELPSPIILPPKDIVSTLPSKNPTLGLPQISSFPVRKATISQNAAPGVGSLNSSFIRNGVAHSQNFDDIFLYREVGRDSCSFECQNVHETTIKTVCNLSGEQEKQQCQAAQAAHLSPFTLLSVDTEKRHSAAIDIATIDSDELITNTDSKCEKFMNQTKSCEALHTFASHELKDLDVTNSDSNRLSIATMVSVEDDESLSMVDAGWFETGLQLHSVSRPGISMRRRKKSVSQQVDVKSHQSRSTEIQLPVAPAARASLLSSCSQARCVEDDQITLFELVRINRLGLAAPLHAFTLSETIENTGHLLSIASCTLLVPSECLDEPTEVTFACWYPQQAALRDRVVITPTVQCSPFSTNLRTPVRFCLPTCYYNNENKLSMEIEMCSDEGVWHHHSVVKSNDSSTVEFETNRLCRYRATVSREHYHLAKKRLILVGFLRKSFIGGQPDVFLWCVCDASPYAEARLWVEMAPCNVYQRVMEPQMFSIKYDDKLQLRLACQGDESLFRTSLGSVNGKNLWLSHYVKKISFEFTRQASSTHEISYCITKEDGEIIRDGILNLPDIEQNQAFPSCELDSPTPPDTANVSASCANKPKKLKQNNTNKVQRAETSASHGFRRLVKRIKNRAKSLH